MKNIYFSTLIALFIAFAPLSYGQNVALDFDGVNDYLITNYAGVSGNSARTIEAWIKTSKNSLPSAAGQSVIVDWGTFVTGGRFTFNVLWNNAIRLEVGGNGLSGTIPVNDGNWHHVAVTYDPSSSPTTNLYVDGLRDVAGNITVAVNTGTANTMRIGNRIDGLNFFEGGIDEVRVYDFEKDSTSIYNDMNMELCGALPVGLVSYFKLNEGIPNGSNASNGLATDYVANNTNALLGFGLSGTSSNWSNGPTLLGGNSSGSMTASDCASYTSPSGNHVWTSTGIYMDTLVNTSGCDSFLTVDLSILQSFNNINVVQCGAYTSPLGNVYTASGTYTDTLSNANAFGCDSFIVIDLFIGTGTTTVIDTTVCDEITISGILITTNTTLFDTLQTSANCDSIITYSVNINNSISTTETFAGCDSVEYNGTWYFATQQFVTAGSTNTVLPCDSSHVVDVIVGQSAISTYDTIIACDSIFIEGALYTQSTNIELLYTNMQGCDSTHFIDLTIDSLGTAIEANSAIGVLYLLGVDDAIYSWYRCEDSSLVVSDSTGFTYAESFLDYQFAVVTTANCSYTTECFEIFGSSITEVYNISFDLYPNPSNGNFYVGLGLENKATNYTILNMVGQEVAKKDLDKLSNFLAEESLVSGMHMIIIETNNGKFANKFLVK